jgi:hypothetical protein
MTGALERPRAVISGDGKYRYHLQRPIGDGGGRLATFIMLNPSTADAERDDATIRKCTGFCRRLGCGLLHVVNLFAIRATDPAEMMRAADPVGADNHEWIRHAVDATVNRFEPAMRGLVICAWGVHGAFMGQDENVLGWLERLCEPMCLGVTRDGQPRHPLYVSYAVKLMRVRATRAKVWKQEKICTGGNEVLDTGRDLNGK